MICCLKNTALNAVERFITLESNLSKVIEFCDLNLVKQHAKAAVRNSKLCAGTATNKSNTRSWHSNISCLNRKTENSTTKVLKGNAFQTKIKDSHVKRSTMKLLNASSINI